MGMHGFTENVVSSQVVFILTQANYSEKCALGGSETAVSLNLPSRNLSPQCQSNVSCGQWVDVESLSDRCHCLCSDWAGGTHSVETMLMYPVVTGTCSLNK